ncbi:hypothetical protein BLA29_010877 [Euroglyphus maynei]|uniref:Uncharacterized protein n=1 Tax=Euroglyphus maynei TaxID=6958 RepID=A0A1Y3BSH1_EURMA|nr:hypothetical protein BLA29_010877 [Euroglyphus maynei]
MAHMHACKSLGRVRLFKGKNESTKPKIIIGWMVSSQGQTQFK